MRRYDAAFLLLAAVTSGAALTACGGGSPSSPLAVASEPPSSGRGLVCTAIAINGPVLVSPAPGSTGVPTTLGTLAFGRLGGIPDIITGTAALSGSDGSTIASGPLTPSPDFSTTTATIAGLHPHTTYTVTASGSINERGCIIPFAANDGTFTTQ